MIDDTLSRVAVVSDYPLDGPGGAETACCEQIRILARAGADVTVITPAGSAACRLATEPGVSVLAVPWRRRLPGLHVPVIRNDSALRHRLRARLRTGQVTAVHLHSELGLASATLDAASATGIPVAFTVHTFFWQATGVLATRPAQAALGLAVPRWHRWVSGHEPVRARLAPAAGDSALRAMTLSVARRSDVVVSPSQHQAGRLRAAGAGRVVVVPNGWSATRPPDPLPSTEHDPLRVVWLGRCSPEKRVVPFVAAACRAIGRVGPARLRVRVIGDGPDLARARRAAGPYAGNAIDFAGRVPHEQIPAELAAADLVALTSYGWDNQPMTVVEAVTAGRPVLYCDPALTEGLAGPDGSAGPGLLTGPEPAALAERLVALSLDRSQVSAAARTTARAAACFAPRAFCAGLAAAFAAARGREQVAA